MALSLLFFIAEVGLHFGFSCGIVHVGLMFHDGRVLEAIIHTLGICACIMLFAVTMYFAHKLLKSEDKA